MAFYEKLPIELLIRFHKEVIENIENGNQTRNMFYELGLIISAANRRGISLEKPTEFIYMVNKQTANALLQSEH